MDKPQFTEEQFDIMTSEDTIRQFMTNREYNLFKDNIKQKGYIILIKEEEPLIVHNVMSYKGKNYLLQEINCLNPDAGKLRCSYCSIPTLPIEGRENFECSKTCRQDEGYYFWKSFDDIQITDELACMRKDIGDIYIRNRVDKQIFRFTHIVQGNKNELYNGCIEYKGGMLMPIAFDLATAEELQEYFKGIKK